MNLQKTGIFLLSLMLTLVIAAGCGSAEHANPPATPEPSQEQPSGKPANPPEDASPQRPDTGSGKTTPSPVPSTELSMDIVTSVRIIDPKSGWIGGNGWIARTDDGGTNWEVQYQGEQTVRQLFALNGQEAWVVFDRDSGSANGPRLLRTTDGGKHWSPVGRMPNDGFLHFVSTQEAFAANAHSKDSGKTWSELPVPENTVGDAYFHDKSNGWAVTEDTGKFLIKRTVDGGKTWSTVMSRDVASELRGTLIRSAGTDDAWVQLIGDSGMTQTAYSLFHTMDGGESWMTVIANSTAGGGPAPGFPMNHTDGPHNAGSAPGPLYVVNQKAAFMGGFCAACEQANTVGWTSDGGKTWNNGDVQTPGYAGALLAFADELHGWWIVTDHSQGSVLYTTSDGGRQWTKTYMFDRRPKG